jgi:hypothetical protein
MEIYSEEINKPGDLGNICIGLPRSPKKRLIEPHSFSMEQTKREGVMDTARIGQPCSPCISGKLQRKVWYPVDHKLKTFGGS